MTPTFPAAEWATALSYAAYRDLSRRLLAEGTTTNGQHTPLILELTTPALARMQALEQEPPLWPALLRAAAALPAQRWLMFSESWCGDAAESLPLWARLADHAPQLELRVLLRDQHPALMDHYLTNGGRSIPKLVAWDATTGRELGAWGPRPAPVQAFVDEYKAQHPQAPLPEFVAAVLAWYRTDDTAALQAELLATLQAWTD